MPLGRPLIIGGVVKIEKIITRKVSSVVVTLSFNAKMDLADFGV